MAKYYTPSIEEFHVGFEYEELIGVDNEQEDWSCKSFNPKNYIDRYGEYTFDETPLSDWIRVKYLDKEDIESLGFIYDIDRDDFNYKGDEYIRLGFNESDHSLMIWNGLDWDDQYIWFDGFIKNKFELKTLLQQLNIKGVSNG